ncbi:MAG TPA: SUMF1/EgtB/PvdO family nonheme iron enzyme [Anaerolineae bacterium]
MTNLKTYLRQLHQNLNVLKEREAKYAGNAPPELLNWIDDHQTAIDLTEQALAGRLAEDEWREALKPLRVSPDPDELEAQRAKLHQTLANLAELVEQGLAMAGAQAQVQQQLAAIEQLLDAARALQAPLFDQREQQVEQQINVAGNYYAGDYYARDPAAATLDEDTALARYLHHVVEFNRRLQLQGIRSAGQLVSIDLEQIYVTLTATERRAVAAGEAHRLARLDPDHPRETVTQVKVEVQEALAAHPRLVVLGDPGSGKTTLLRYLALTYARDRGGEAGLVTARLALSEQRLPILLPLRDFARYLEAQHPDSSLDGPKLLLDYLRTYFANQDIALPERFFAGRLQRSECAVLLDGVDEVANVATRHRVARIIERFTMAYPDNRYVVTSRLVGYTGSARLGEGYVVTRVRDFSESDIRNFVTHWNLAVELTLARADTPEARRQAQQLSEALMHAIQKNERIRELAVNPLLLTVIALVQRYRAQLPERRTELYEEAVEVLLGQWDVAKGLSETTYLGGRELDAGDRRSLLEPIALWMMEQQLREIETDELCRHLSQQFTTMISDPHQVGKAVDGFIRLISERSGLLNERGYGIYSFSHLTFQEHLAGRAVADRPDYIPYTLTRLADSWWREVILLEAGYLSTQGKRRGTALIEAIMDYPDEPELFHNLVLAAECVRDVGVARIEGDLAGQIQQRIRGEFERPWQKGNRETIERRARAAEALARIESGGSGLQPAFWRLPYGEPAWVEVPAGEFWLGRDKGGDDEKPVHRLFLEAFKIARAPITNAQYHFFVEATGHRSPRHWKDGRPPRGLESHPVVAVTWHDALAYCRWLAEVTGQSITLPSEAQWEKAARGPQDRREYPWGNDWDETKCNTNELGLGETTPVGIFPDGASPYGGLDMAGNVWEWTTSQFKEYPYDPADGRENLEAGDKALRVWRGGSFSRYRSRARCAARYWDLPDLWYFSGGFRVVVSPISPPSAL